MILKKPYAILIKFFKLIHIILFVLCVLMIFKLRSNYIFLQSLVGFDNYVPASNIASEYIGLWSFLIVFVILFMAVAIYYLMRQKEKPVLFYRIFIIYSVSLLVVFIVYSSFYGDLGDKVYDSLTLSIYRDIMGAFYYLTYFYVGFTFIRGFGFDIKKFSFEKDLKDLNISEADSEEYELSVGIDKEKIVSAFRKEKRYARYYFKENAMTLLIIAGIALIGIGFISYRNVKENIIYSQDKVLIANNLEYQIKKTYVTNTDKYGDNLSANYIIVLFKVTNNNDVDLKIDLNKNRIMIDEEYFYPITNANYNFSDLGNCYKNQIISAKGFGEYMFIFKTINNVREKDVILELYDTSHDDNNVSITSYKKYRLNKEYFASKNFGEYKLDESIMMDNMLFNNVSIKIDDYAIANNFIDEYEECIEEKCLTYKKVITNGNEKIIKFNVDNDLIVEDLFNNYASLYYKINNNQYEIESKNFNVIYKGDNVIYLGVNNDITNGKDLALKFDIRGSVYTIFLDKERKDE